MSAILELLEGVKVEWMALGKVLIRTKGTNITAGRMKELHKEGAPMKIFAGGKTFAFIDFEDVPEKDINRKLHVTLQHLLFRPKLEIHDLLKRPRTRFRKPI